MALKLMLQRDGVTLRREWYGVFEDGGKRRVVNLNVPWKGTPPASLRVGDAGDATFEASRVDAENALAAFVEEARRKGRVEHLTERLIESKSGQAVKYVRIDEIDDCWRKLDREIHPTIEHLENCKVHFRRFVDFMRKRNPGAVFLYEVTQDDAAAFRNELKTPDEDGKRLSPSTVRYGVRLITKAMQHFLPTGGANPFGATIRRRGSKGKEESGVVHRKPFTAAELQAILDAARGDSFMYPLIVTAACSGMRRGDVCNLGWHDVDLAGGMLNVNTHKTGEPAEIPIFMQLRGVLEARHPRKKGLVFPEAAAMYKANPDGLSYRFKCIVAKALRKEPEPAQALPAQAAVSAESVQDEGVIAIMENCPEGERRDRILDTFKRYCAGQSARDIERQTGRIRSTISVDLHAVQNWIGKEFLRPSFGKHTKHNKCSMRKQIAEVTRVDRQQGMLSASVYDWHALRTTWVTIALTAGVPMELVRRITGHKTVEIVLKHYFRPDREHFRAALAGALPEVLTGAKVPQLPADELAALAGKLAAGTATAQDKARFKKLAAKV
jgi:integrase